MEYDDKNGVMFCRTCRKFPALADRSSPLFTGTTNFRVDPLKYHQRSWEHVACQQRFESQSKEHARTVLHETTIGKALVGIDETQKRLRCLFNTAYAVGKRGKPFSDFEYICELQVKNGLDLGENYLKDNACQRFISSAATILQQDIKTVVSRNRFVSVLADGSTDSVILEQELVYLRYIDLDCRPITRLIDIVPLESKVASLLSRSVASRMGRILKVEEFGDIRRLNTEPVKIVLQNGAEPTVANLGHLCK